LNFSELDLHPDLLDGIEALNYTTATPIQEQSIPIILEGRDLVGVAQTGTGKTAAFVLPILNEILEAGEIGFTQALIVVPTRELAVQIDKVVEAYSYYTGISSMAIYGGVDGKGFAQEKTALTEGTDIIIATPGRLIAHINLGYIDFSKLRFLVLDEADRMLDMGFKPDLLKITTILNKERQSLFFSATMPKDVEAFANTLLKNPARVSIAVSKPAEKVTQVAFQLSDRQKLPFMVNFLKDRVGQRIIVFGSTKISVSALYNQLKNRRMNVGQISSDVEQSERELVMNQFRGRKIDILIATDVLSRGIDVADIEVVVNYDVPRAPEDYVHRIGRTARAEREGEAFTLVSPEDALRFKKIEQFLGKKIELGNTNMPFDDEPAPRRGKPAGRGGSSGGGSRGGSGGGGNNRSPRPENNARRPEKRPQNPKPAAETASQSSGKKFLVTKSGGGDVPPAE
jgi:ATP-dependent RNA helicase RhlE